jgi:taurine dioxygenase
MSRPPFAIRPLSGALGAEIADVDLSKPLESDAFEAIHGALLEHHVLVFRGQVLSRPEQLDFARRFGEPEVHPIADGLPEHPEVIRVLKPAGEAAFFGTSWHTDNTFFERPTAATVLYGEQVPPVGGDTLFASMTKAWETLSPPMQAFLEPLTAIHSASSAYDPKTTGDAKYKGEAAITYTYSDSIYDEVEHPVVRTHPESGRRALFVNPMFTQRIAGLHANESDALLELLYQHATRPELLCRVRWQPGTVTVWDNRCVQHYAIDDYADFERVMYRVTVAGERPRR